LSLLWCKQTVTSFWHQRLCSCSIDGTPGIGAMREAVYSRER
jgi:hypothetical protein